MGSLGHLGDGRAFHLAGESAEGIVDPPFAVMIRHEGIASGDGAPMDGPLPRRLLGYLLKSGQKGFVRMEQGGLVFDLKALAPIHTAQSVHVEIMLDQVRAEHHVPYLQTRADAAGHAGVDEIIRVGTVDEDLGAAGGVHLADAALCQHHVERLHVPR